jgi:hypothetical protein
MVNSDDNRLTFNRSISNLDNGYYLMGGNNWLVKNRAEKCGDEGFYSSSASEKNKIYINRAIANEREGFQFYGHENRILHNLAKDNLNDGISIDGNKNFVYKNKSFNNSEKGIEVDGRENSLIKNRVNQNQGNGIFIEKFDERYDLDEQNMDNVLIRNIILENLEYDIFNENPECLHNTLKNNKFYTSNVDCTQ